MKFTCNYIKGWRTPGSFCGGEATHYYLFGDEPTNPYEIRCDKHDLSGICEVDKETFVITQVMNL